MLIFILPVKVSPCSQTQHMVGPTNLIASAAVISSLCSFFFHHSIAFSFSFPLLSRSRFRVCARDMTGRHEAAAELPLRARRVQGDNGGLRAPPPPLPTLILSARRGRPRAERRGRSGGGGRSGTGGTRPWEERSSMRPSEAAWADRAARAAGSSPLDTYPFVSFQRHCCMDTRTRRVYVSRPYPRRIRVGYVSDTGYAPSLPYPCF